MTLPITGACDVVEQRDIKIQKLQKQLKAANLIIVSWDAYGDEHGCSNDEMNELYVKTDKYIKEHIL